jgi:hypothetical protein
VKDRQAATARALCAVAAAAGFVVFLTGDSIWSLATWPTVGLFTAAPVVVLLAVALCPLRVALALGTVGAAAMWLLLIVYLMVGIGLLLLPAALLSTSAVLRRAGLPRRSPQDEFRSRHYQQR